MDAITSNDNDILRRLVTELAEAAADPVNKERADLWRNVNDLKATRPTLWMNELPVDQLNIDDSLTCQCQSDWARAEEASLRWRLQQWKKYPGDMVVQPFYDSQLMYNDSGFGVSVEEHTKRSETAGDVVSHSYESQFDTIEDLDKITMPVVTLDEAGTEENFQRRSDCFGDIMPIRKRGLGGYWYSPLDCWVVLRGPMNFLMDLMDKPEFVDAAIERMSQVELARLEQYRALGLQSANAREDRIGSGGFGFVSALPETGDNMPTDQCWGSAAAQMASEISPEMHWEYILKHEMKWLEQWGLTYYGCCEPLHHKMDILGKIPNLRKVSMSPWTKPEVAVETVTDKYVYSFKPNPAFLAENTFRPEASLDEIRTVLDIVWPAGCHVEIIMKDVSTIRYQPQRLIDWHDCVMDLLKQYTR